MEAATRIGFLGLGNMGTPMARRLLAAGHELTVWNRTARKAEPLGSLGARVAATPAEAASRCDVVITMVRDGAALAAVVVGDEGVATALAPGSLLVDMSTVGPDTVRRMADALPPRTAFVDAPVLGSVDEARAGTLRIFVGADEALFRRAEPVLAVLGAPMLVGPRGSGAAAKLVANSTLLAVLGALGEALALGTALGLSRESLHAVLAATPLAAQAQRRRPAIEAGDYPLRFALALARKDADLIVEAADRRRLALRVAPAVAAWFAEAERAGWDERDYSAILGWLLERVGDAQRSEEAR